MEQNEVTAAIYVGGRRLSESGCQVCFICTYNQLIFLFIFMVVGVIDESGNWRRIIQTNTWKSDRESVTGVKWENFLHT